VSIDPRVIVYFQFRDIYLKVDMASQAELVPREAAASGISPKVFAGGVGSTVATIFWIAMTATVWKHVFNVEQVSTLTGATASFLSLMFGYLIRDRLRAERSNSSRWSVIPGRKRRLAAIEARAVAADRAAAVNAAINAAGTRAAVPFPGTD
jgi:hypothetical protein